MARVYIKDALKDVSNEINEIAVKEGSDLTITTSEEKTVVLSEPVWRDEYPVNILEAGAAAAPSLTNVTIGNVLRRMWGFTQNGEDRLSGSFEIPHDMLISETILPELHIHWRPAGTGTGTVVWFIDWEYSPPNAAAIPMTTLEVEAVIDSNKQNWHILNSFGHLPLPAGGYIIGGKIGFNLRRNGGVGQDNYGALALFEQVALHIPVDTQGSRQIYVK